MVRNLCKGTGREVKGEVKTKIKITLKGNMNEI